MSFDLMGMIHNAMSWFGGGDVGKNGGHADGKASVGAGTFGAHSEEKDPLGTLAGGFGPMDWKGAGFGGSVDGKLSNKNNGAFMGGNLGLGIGAGYSQWQNDGKTGVSGASGGVAPVGFEMGGKNTKFDASTNVYTGVGGSAYKDEHGGGFSANAVPLGLGNTKVGLDTKYGSVDGSAGNAYLNKYSAHGEAGNDNGRYYAKGGVSQTMGATDVDVNLKTKYYQANAGVGEISKGPVIEGGGYYDSKTGSFGLEGGKFDAALDAKDIHTSSNIGNGAVTNKSSIGQLKYDEEYGIEGARAGWDNKNKQVTAGFEKISGGGVLIKDAKTSGNIGGLKYSAGGDFQNQNTITGGDFKAGRDGIEAKVEKMQGMGMEAKDVHADANLGNAKAHFDFGDLGNQNTLEGAHAGIDYKNWKDPKLTAGFEHLNYGGVYGDNMNASFKGYGVDANAHLGHFNTANFDATGASATLDKNGLDARLKTFDYSDFSIKDANYGIKSKYYNASAKADEIASDKVNVQGAHVNSSWDPRKGIAANVDKASYDEVYLKGIAADQNIGNGAYTSHLGLGEGSMNHASAQDIYASANLTDGVKAGLSKGEYSFLQGKDINAKIGLGNGAVGVGVGAKDAEVGKVGIDKLAFDSNLRNTNLDVQGLNATGFKAHDINANANVGKLGLGVGAQTLATNDLHVDSASLHSQNFGTQGNAAVSGVNFDALNMKGGHAGLDWGGKEVLGAGADVRAGTGVDSAKANWDLLHGTAGAQFKNANIGGQIDNAHVNLFGHDFNLPSMGAKLNASGGANVDLAHGAANANIGLGGSNVNFAGHNFTVPDWVQAGAGVNLSQGAANFNLGGKNGVGANMNIANGQFSVDAFGHHVDVAQGARDAANWVGNTASSAAHTVADGASNAYHAVTGAVGGAVDKVLSW